MHLSSATNRLYANCSGSSEWLSAHSSPAAWPVCPIPEPTSTPAVTSRSPYVGESTSLKRKSSRTRTDVGGGTIFSVTGYEDFDRPAGKITTSDHVALVVEDREKHKGEGEEDGESDEDLHQPDPDPLYTTVLSSWPVTTLQHPPSVTESGPKPTVELEPEHIYSHPSPRPHREYSVYSYDGMYVMPSQTLHSDLHRTSNCHHYEEIIDTAVNVAYLYSQSVTTATDATYNQGTSITPDLASIPTSHSSACHSHSLPKHSLHPPPSPFPQVLSPSHPSPDRVGCGGIK